MLIIIFKNQPYSDIMMHFAVQYHDILPYGAVIRTYLVNKYPPPHSTRCKCARYVHRIAAVGHQIAKLVELEGINVIEDPLPAYTSPLHSNKVQNLAKAWT